MCSSDLKYLWESTTSMLIEFFQNKTNPPPLFSLGVTHFWSKLILLKVRSSLTLSAHVSAINTTEGSFACINLTSSFSVRGFPSPQQFHNNRLIASSRADYQPSPISYFWLHLPMKPFFFLVTQFGLFHYLYFFFPPLLQTYQHRMPPYSSNPFPSSFSIPVIDKRARYLRQRYSWR